MDDLFRPDSPISTKDEDRFQRSTFAERIARIVSNGKFSSSLTVGIYGKWGEGKSSVLKLIQAELDPNAVVINFNPWLFNDETKLIQAFFLQIAGAVGKKLHSKKERAAKLLIQYADSIGSLANLALPGSSGLVEMGKKYSEKIVKNTVEELKLKIDELIISSDANFVIFIDDIDRLEALEVQLIFKLIKLAGDFPRTAYILSFDDDMVAAALGPKYGAGDKNSGYEFLEKIIQVPLQLPKANAKALRSYTIDLINQALKNLNMDISEEEAQDFLFKFDKAFVPALINPRLGVRYANSISFSLPLLKGEVHVSDLMIVEAIKVFYPSLYHFIRNKSKLFIRNYSNIGNTFYSVTQQEREGAKNEINASIAQYEDLKSSVLEMLMDLFPQLRALYHGHGFSEESYQQWYREQRICMAHYFERYFSYVVLKGDISDVYFNDLFSTLARESFETSLSRFKAELPKLNIDTFLFKLRQHVSRFDDYQSEALSKILASLGEFFSPNNAGMIFSQRREASYIIKGLLEQVSKDRRQNVCVELLKIAQPFEFVNDINKLRLGNEGIPIGEPKFLEVNEIDTLKAIIVERFKNEITLKPFFEYQDSVLWNVFDLFYQLGRAQEVTDLFSDTLAISKENSLRIIKIFTPTVGTIGGSGGRYYKAGFDREHHEWIGRFIDPEIIFKATVEVWGTKQYVPVSDPKNDELNDDNLIGKFQHIHSIQIRGSV